MTAKSTYYHDKYFKGRSFCNLTLKMLAINRVEPLLNEYFGLNYGHFEHLIDTAKVFDPNSLFYSKPYEEQIEELKGLDDLTFEISHITTYDEFSELFIPVEVEDEQDNGANIILTLWMLAYCVVVNQIDDILREKAENEGNYYLTRYGFEEDMENEWNTKYKIREDLLKLYIFVNQPHKWPRTEEGRRITLKHSLGNVDIGNYDNWFLRNVIERYCNKYIPEITSLEQAEEELQAYKKPLGRQPKDPQVNIILYGIYRLFNEKMKMPSPQSDSLCEFIINYLEFLRLIDEDSPIDKQWVRAQIAYIKKRPEPPKYRFADFTRNITMEEFKEKSRLSGLL